jgi:hypothetical protein
VENLFKIFFGMLIGLALLVALPVLITVGVSLLVFSIIGFVLAIIVIVFLGVSGVLALPVMLGLGLILALIGALAHPLLELVLVASVLFVLYLWWRGYRIHRA